MMNDTDKTKISNVLDQKLDDLEQLFEEIDGIVWLYLSNKEAAKENPKRAQRKKELTEFSKTLSAILERKPTVELLFSGTKEYADILTSAESLNKILDVVVREPSAHGPEPDDRVWLISRLAELFIEATGMQPTITWDDLNEKYSGKFFDFCRIIFPGPTDAGVGAIIKKVLYLRKKDKK